MRFRSLSIKNAYSRLKAETFRLWTTGLQRLSVFPVPRISPESAAALRKIFLDSGFASSSMGDSPDENPDLITLKRLFVHGKTVTDAEAARAFSPLKLDKLIRSGFLHQDGNLVQSMLQAQSYEGLILFSDFRRHEHAEDCVLPVGPSGDYLANLTLRRPVRATLDLGCGCGLLSLLAARHSDLVTATDINPRALAVTRLNADLNGVSNIELLEGSYLEPVKGRRFDLILANLPYVITPENRLIYRDTTGDAYLHQLLRDLPAHLVEGGFALILANWIYAKEEPWWSPLERTLEELGMDAWLIHKGTKTPEGYADKWLDAQLKKDKRKYARTKEAWVKWYRDQGIEQIALGDVILRRRASGTNWVSSSSVTKRLDSPAGEQLARMFETQDFLASLPDNEALLDTSLVPVDMDIRTDEVSGRLEAFTTTGLNFTAGISPFTAEVIRGLDGRTRLSAAIGKAGQGADDDPTLLLDINILLGLGMLAKAPVSGG